MADVPAHDQAVDHKYTIHYWDHQPREGDPHYADFEAYRKRTVATAQCAFAQRTGDTSGCSGPLELHHSHVEFALQNGVDLKLLERDYPGISDPSQVGAWVETAENLQWLCQFHHLGHGGVHVASSADYEAEHYIHGLIH